MGTGVCEINTHRTFGWRRSPVGVPPGISMLPLLHMETNDANERFFRSRLALSTCTSFPTLRFGGWASGKGQGIMMSVFFADTGLHHGSSLSAVWPSGVGQGLMMTVFSARRFCSANTGLHHESSMSAVWPSGTGQGLMMTLVSFTAVSMTGRPCP